MRIAHLSDIHFFKFDFRPKTFFTKSILATFNYLINRRKNKVEFEITQIPNILKENKVSHVVITGDFTTTSNHKEYNEARNFILSLKEKGFKVLTLPGNHDTYTKKAALSKRFHHRLSTPTEFREHAIYSESFTPDYEWICLDTTIATPLWSSQGFFSKTLQEKLTQKLNSIPKDRPIIIVNHFPILSNKKRPQRHQMIRREHLRELLKQYPNVKIYLCGHTHLSEIIEGRPLILNSGSLTLTQGGSFHIMNLEKDSVEVETFSYQNASWQKKAAKKVFLP